MNLEEYAAKRHVLLPAGVPIPNGMVCRTPEEASAAVAKIGPSVVKAQVPTGKRGKSGGIKMADSADDGAAAARAILGMTIGGSRVERVLIEERCPIERELYAAVLVDVGSRSPLVLFSTEGGMDIEEVAERKPDAIRRHVVDVERGFGAAEAAAPARGDGSRRGRPTASPMCWSSSTGRFARRTPNWSRSIRLPSCAAARWSRWIASSCWTTPRRRGSPNSSRSPRRRKMTALEERGAAHGLRFIQLDGNVGVLANGAGLTMTTMDVIDHFGGRPANFLEIGGEAYTKAEVALDLVLSNPGVKSLVVNFCGAFARTDVMADGVVRAWEKLKPKIPAFFSIHGTGEDEAVKLVRERLGIEPYDLMEDAVKAAVEAAQ